MSINILRLDLWIDPCFDELVQQEKSVNLNIMKLADPDEINFAKLAETDIYHVSAAKDEVPRKYQVTAELLARCPRIKVVSSTGAGYDTVDVDACTDAGVLVVNQAGGNANSVAEHAIALMLAVSRRIVESDHLIKTATGFRREQLMGRELAGQMVGIVGIGHTGSRVAQLANAFGMQVQAYDPYVDDAEIRARGATPVSFETLLATSDIVSLHCPRNKETMGMFGANEFRAMRKGAMFVTTARGGIHDEQALYEALKDGHLSGAGLDVWMVEPPPHDHPLLTLPNVVATYHTAGVTHEGRRNIARIAALQVLDICAGRTPPRTINPQVLPVALERLESAQV